LVQRGDSVDCLKEREDVNSRDYSKRDRREIEFGRGRWLLMFCGLEFLAEMSVPKGVTFGISSGGERKKIEKDRNKLSDCLTGKKLKILQQFLTV
jgi:hypothetical protein